MPTKYYGDNKSVCESCANENAECESRNSSISYHKMRESVEAGMITLHHVCSEENVANVLTKPLGIETRNDLTNRVLRQDLTTTHLMQPPNHGK